MRLQVLASDYDDTLARRGQVDEIALDRIRAARKAGVTVVLVTGRRMSELLEVFAELNEVDFVVAENGGYAYSPKEGRGWPLARALDQTLVDHLRARGVDPLYVGETIVSTVDPWLDVVLEVIAEHPAGYSLIRNRESLMLLPHGIDKGFGLTAALTALGVPAEASVAVGDAENDITLLEAAGRGIAVGDAVVQLKEQADLVTGAPGPQGVVELVDLLAAADWELDALARTRDRLGEPRAS